MMKNTKILALMCNTELMGIWRSNQGSVIYEYIFCRKKRIKGAKQDTVTTTVYEVEVENVWRVVFCHVYLV
jgi:hypothetical protein